MIYKTGEVPQVRDEVLGQVDGKPARGRVLAVREKGGVLITRRAPYEGKDQPLAAEHHEVPSEELSLVYRPMPKGPGPIAGRDGAGKGLGKGVPSPKAKAKAAAKA